MANIIINNPLSMQEKMNLMTEDAKFDIADNPTSDLSCIAGFNNIKANKTPPKIPKVFLSNNCIFNCAYCCCRTSNEEKRRYCHNPKELAKMAVDEAIKKKHGVFVTSAIYKNPDYTEELIIETLKSMRNDLNYNGFIHAKIMPGTDPLLIEKAGDYADRLSVNIEVAQSIGYSKIAKQKNKNIIITPMQQISDLIKAKKSEKIISGRKFATSQTTQLMAGSIEEDDRTIMTLSKALYKKYSLKRVYYTAFQYKVPVPGYDIPLISTPLWRMTRLYQADRLLQLYGFTPDDVTPIEQPNLEFDIDPKASWAMRNLHLFPIEVNTADYEMLIRVPGIGITFARKILEVRKRCIITHEILKRMGVSFKKSIYFITCNGKYSGGNLLDNPLLRSKLALDKNSFNTPIEQMAFDLEY